VAEYDFKQSLTTVSSTPMRHTGGDANTFDDADLAPHNVYVVRDREASGYDVIYVTMVDNIRKLTKHGRYADAYVANIVANWLLTQPKFLRIYPQAGRLFIERYIPPAFTVDDVGKTVTYNGGSHLPQMRTPRLFNTVCHCATGETLSLGDRVLDVIWCDAARPAPFQAMTITKVVQAVGRQVQLSSGREHRVLPNPFLSRKRCHRGVAISLLTTLMVSEPESQNKKRVRRPEPEPGDRSALCVGCNSSIGQPSDASSTHPSKSLPESEQSTSKKRTEPDSVVYSAVHLSALTEWLQNYKSHMWKSNGYTVNLDGNTLHGVSIFACASKLGSLFHDDRQTFRTLAAEWTLASTKGTGFKLRCFPLQPTANSTARNGYRIEVVSTISSQLFSKMFEFQRRVKDLYPGYKDDVSFWKDKLRGDGVFCIIVYDGDAIVSLASCQQ